MTKAPVLDDYRNAFFDMEGSLSRLGRHAKVLEYLAAWLIDAADKKENGALTASDIAEVTAQAAFSLIEAFEAADKDYYERFNALVGRENAAIAAGRGMV